ncbi:MAG: cation diffusion facilitator family transporter [Clostridia bacterium]|nr:cation diffusion facilitator family transporter [Clostridia bacterium]
MVSVLRKLLIKAPKGSEEYRSACGYLCGAVGIAFNLLLVALKFFAGIISNSIAITADAANNLSDAGSSIVTLLGFKIAGQKADSEHPYGHGRMEYIAGFIVSILIMIMSWSLITSSVKKIIHPEETVFSPVIAVILIVSILVKCYMAIYNTGIGKEIDSVALHATAIDSLSDCIATGTVLAVTLISHFFGLNIDGYAGVVVGLFVGYTGVKAAMDTLNPLLGLPPEESFVKSIEETCLSFNENILGIHDMLIHDYGPGRKYVSLHAEVPAEGDILELHEIIDALEKEIGEKEHCFITVHMDPIVTADAEVINTKYALQTVIEKINNGILLNSTHKHHKKESERNLSISMHDFRMVPGDNRTNLVFDIVVPFGGPHSDSEIIDYINKEIKAEMGDKYVAVIQVDHDMGTTKD